MYVRPKPTFPVFLGKTRKNTMEIGKYSRMFGKKNYKKFRKILQNLNLGSKSGDQMQDIAVGFGV